MTSGGLRERKNERTRRAITRATVELTLSQGYEQTSIAQIAERADVAPRTVFAWFAHKDDIVFDRGDVPFERLREILGARATGDDTMAAIHAWLLGERERTESALDELERLRFRAIMADPYLRGRLHGKFGTLEALVADSVAADTGLAAADVGPRAFAAAVTTILLGLIDRSIVGDADPDVQLGQGMDLLRGALNALVAEPPAARRAPPPA